jgi:hypothetical protein
VSPPQGLAQTGSVEGELNGDDAPTADQGGEAVRKLMEKGLKPVQRLVDHRDGLDQQRQQQFQQECGLSVASAVLRLTADRRG